MAYSRSFDNPWDIRRILPPVVWQSWGFGHIDNVKGFTAWPVHRSCMYMKRGSGEKTLTGREEGRKITLNSQQQYLFFGDRKLKPKLLKSQEVASSTCFLWFTINWMKVSSLKMLKWKMGEFQTGKGKDERLLGVKLTPYSNRLGRAGCTVGRCQGGFKKSPHYNSSLFSELQSKLLLLPL